MPLRYLYFVRHGQYVHTARVEGGVLTPLGRRQARRTGDRFSRVPLARLVASDLGRARETAAIIASRLPRTLRIRADPRLREAIPTGVPGATVPRVKRARGKRQLEQICAEFVKPSPRTRHELFVCHGNLIRALACRVLGVRATAWFNFGTHHCGVTRLTVRPDGRVLVDSYNDTGHLPTAMVTIS